jgi:hypothetical protein
VSHVLPGVTLGDGCLLRLLSFISPADKTYFPLANNQQTGFIFHFF